MNNLSASNIFGNILISVLQILSPILILLAAVIVVYTIFTACSSKFLSKDGQAVSFGRLLVGGFSKSITMIIEKLPSFIVIGLVVTAISLVSNFFNQFYTIWQQSERIKELNCYVKNLSNSEDIAIITVKNRTTISNNTYSTYLVQVVDNITGDIVTEEEINLSGKEFKLDSLVVNFDYSEIETGKSRNVAFPYKIFSEKLAPDNGITLKTLMTLENVDDILEMEAQSVYGLSKETFIKRAKEFIEIIKDPVKSREMGIKSSYGETITIPASAKIGDTFYVRITGVGGLTLTGSGFSK